MEYLYLIEVVVILILFSSGCYLQLENNSNQPSRLFLQPSYNVLHLLEVSPAQQNELLDNKGDKGWTSANNNYFKCLAMMQQLQQASLSFSKDLDLEQVKFNA